MSQYLKEEGKEESRDDRWSRMPLQRRLHHAVANAGKDCYILRFSAGLLAGATMPLYEYACDSCGETIEALQRFSDPPLETCGSCGGTLEKLISAPSIQFKGTGWYVTDYARKGADSQKKTETDKKDPAKAAAESSAPKADSKKKS